jgi:flagellar protein FlgJ
MLEAAPSTSLDLAGLEHLKRRAAREDPAALAEAAVQFEALFIGLMLKSARDASLGEGILDGEATRQYLELMDQQVALELARKGGFGFGKLIVGELSPLEPGAASAEQPADPRLGPLAPRTDAVTSLPRPPPPRDVGSQATAPSAAALGFSSARDPAADGASSVPPTDEHPPSAQEAFVRRLLPEATAAARSLGVEPRVLLAQAALETGWGAATASDFDGGAANNLFGIKAGGDWNGARVARWTIEHEDGGAVRRRETFRAYSQPADSFADYVRLIAGSPRYAAALERAGDPEAYARAVADAGYATDPDYVEKWMSIYHGDRLDSALRDIKTPPSVPTQ